MRCIDVRGARCAVILLYQAPVLAHVPTLYTSRNSDALLRSSVCVRSPDTVNPDCCSSSIILPAAPEATACGCDASGGA